MQETKVHKLCDSSRKGKMAKGHGRRRRRILLGDIMGTKKTVSKEEIVSRKLNQILDMRIENCDLAKRHHEEAVILLEDFQINYEIYKKQIEKEVTDG